MKNYLVALVYLTTLFVPTISLASSGPLDAALLVIDPPPGDISGRYIKELFLSDGAMPSALSDVIGEINKVWFIFCGLLIFFMMSIGLVHSAADGDFFGKKHSVVFVPARILIAATMLVPSGTDHLSLIQKAVAQVSYYSIGAASRVWEMTISSVAQGKTLTPPGDPNAPDVVRVLLEGEVCRLIITRFINDPNNVAQAAGARNSIVWNFDMGDGKGIFSADYVRNGTLIRRGICGEITLTLPKGGFNPTAASSSFDNLISPDSNIDLAAFNAQNQWIRGQLNGELRGLAYELFQKIMIDGDLGDAERRKGIGTSYRLINDYNRLLASSIHNEAVKSGGSVSRGLPDLAKTEGWSSAGASFLMLTRLNSQVVSAATSRISARDFLATNGERSGTPSPFSRKAAIQSLASIFGQAGTEDLLIQMNKVRELTEIVTGQISDGLVRKASQAGVRLSDISMLKSVVPTNSGFFKSLIEAMSNGGDKAANPFEANINFGHNLVLFGGSIAGISGRAGDLQKLPMGRGMVMIVESIASRETAAGTHEGIDQVTRSLGLALYFAGIVLAYVMPMLPAMFWILGVVGFMVLVLEAVIAAPLWMLGHLSLDGDGFAGSRGVAGYEVLLSLIVRPTAMVVGLVIAIVIYQFGSVLIARSMYPAIVSAAGGHIGGLTGLVVWTIMTAIVSAMLTFTVFKESLAAADRLTNWVSIRAAGSSSENISRAQQMGAILGYQAMTKGSDHLREEIDATVQRRAEAASSRVGSIMNVRDSGEGRSGSISKSD